MAIAYSLFFLLFLVIGLLFCGRVILVKTGLIYAVKKWWRIIEEFFHVYQLFKVPEFNESMQENQLYRKVYVYLNSLPSMEDSNYTNLFTGKKPNDIILRLDPNQIIDDDFLGARVSWINDEDGDIRNFVLKIRKADKRRILRPYLQHIHTVSDELEEQKTDLKLYMNTDSSDFRRNRRWTSVPFKHPATFDTIAMESDLKNKVKADLESFVKAKQYYHRLGRVWKRSYLLYGPSGTGKSSFVAAMANFLGYDVYDIDLSKVRSDSDLKMLLLQATRKSVVVIEDLDRFLMEKSTIVSLSGILNFMDGLLNSSCAEERIMVVTMSNKEQIDPAILRPGRIDVHIHFPVCDFSSFKNLASSYLGLKDHKLFPRVEEVFNGSPSLSPAEIGELMITNRSSPSRALKTVINALESDVGRRLSENLARKSTEECEEYSGIFCRESGHTMKELRKFVGLIRMKSSRKSQSFDLASSQHKEG